METLTKLVFLVLLTIVQGADPLSDFYQLAWPDEGTCDYTYYQTPSEYVLHTAFIYSLEDCASMCIAADDCTGFESRQTQGTSAQPHCLLWMRGACSNTTSPHFTSATNYAPTYVRYTDGASRPPPPPPLPSPPTCIGLSVRESVDMEGDQQ